MQTLFKVDWNSFRFDRMGMQRRRFGKVGLIDWVRSLSKYITVETIGWRNKPTHEGKKLDMSKTWEELGVEKNKESNEWAESPS